MATVEKAAESYSYELDFYPRSDCPAEIWTQTSFADIHQEWFRSDWNPIRYQQYEVIVPKLLELGFWEVEYRADHIYLHFYVTHLFLQQNDARLKFGYYSSFLSDEITEHFTDMIRPTIRLLETIAGFYTMDRQLKHKIDYNTDIPKMIEFYKKRIDSFS